MAKGWSSGLLLLSACAACGASSCSLTIDTEALSDPTGEVECTDSQKECGVEGAPRCVELDDPTFGCSRVNCVPCYLEHAQAICSPASGQCVIGNCIGSWENCDRADSNGCEADLNTDPKNCGSCGTICQPLPHAEDVRCGSASCYIRICDKGFGNCDRNDSNGCEVDLSTDPKHCGACNSPCEGECIDGVCRER